MCLVLLCAAPAPAPRVLLWVGAASEVSRQLEGELRVLGYQVVVEGGAPAGWKPLRQRARQLDAIAAIQLEDQGDELEVQVSDRLTGKVLIRVLKVGGSPPRSVAMRAIELLRLSFRELGEPEAVASAEVPAPPSGALLAQPNEERFAVGVHLGALASPGGASLSGLAAASAGLRFAQRWHFEVSAWLPLVPAEVTGPEGRADLRWWAGLLGARLMLTPDGNRLGVGVVARAGVIAASVTGTATPPYRSGVDRLAGPLGLVGTWVSLKLPAGLSLVAELVGGAALPPFEVRFGQRPAARWGLGVLGATLGLQVAR